MRSRNRSYRREGAGDYLPASPLPLTHESVRRFLDLEDSASSSVWTGVWGQAPITAWGEESAPRRRRVFTPIPAKHGVAVTRRMNTLMRRINVDPRLAVCVRRAQRRQVLFAMRRAGRRGSAPGPYRRSPTSQWSC